MNKKMMIKILILVGLIAASVIIVNCYTKLSHPEIELPKDYEYSYDYYRSYGYGRCSDCHTEWDYFPYRHNRYYSHNWRYYYTYPRWWYDYYWDDYWGNYWYWEDYYDDDDDGYIGPPQIQGGRHIGDDQKGFPPPVNSGENSSGYQHWKENQEPSDDEDENIPPSKSRRLPPSKSRLKPPPPKDNSVSRPAPPRSAPSRSRRIQDDDDDDDDDSGSGSSGGNNDDDDDDSGVGGDNKGF
jgi:hypothetical protein